MSSEEIRSSTCTERTGRKIQITNTSGMKTCSCYLTGVVSKRPLSDLQAPALKTIGCQGYRATKREIFLCKMSPLSTLFAVDWIQHDRNLPVAGRINLYLQEL